jgi:hypothetical protein
MYNYAKARMTRHNLSSSDANDPHVAGSYSLACSPSQLVCAAAASYDGMLFQVAFEAGERPYLILLQKDGV